MSATTERRGPSLRMQITVGSALLVALPVVASFVAALVFGGRIADQTVEASLSRSKSVQTQFRESRAQQLALISQTFSSDPAFGSYIAEAAGGIGSSGNVDRLSIVDLLRERQAELGFDFAIVLDADGIVLARTDRPQSSGADLTGDPWIAGVVDSAMPSTGLWRNGGLPYQTAVVPLARNLDLIGFLITGLAVDDRLAAEISRVGGTDVLFLTGAADNLTGLASSLDSSRSRRLLDLLQDESEPVTSASTGSRELARFEISVDGERLVGRLDPLTDAAGEPFGSVLTFTSLDRQLFGFRSIQRVVLGVGLVAMAIGVLLSVLLAKRTLQPVRELGRAAEAAVGGDYGQSVAVPRGEELGRMAVAFNTLIGDLRERREMSTYVRDITRHLPDPVVETPTTTAGVATGSQSEEATRIGTYSPTRTPLPLTDSLPAGNLIGGRYEILATLGPGGMGVVYKARDRELDELVAIKLLQPEMLARADHLERLKDEIRLARKITHPNVLRTFDYGEADGVHYISMEYVRGLTLSYLLSMTRRVPYAAGLHLARQLCDGLLAAHAVGVVHRDIKPGNLILEQSGNAKLMDFGIAVMMRPETAEQGVRIVAGTPPYLPPEAFTGADVGVAGDVYASGVVLFEMFTGERPFRAATLGEMRALKQQPAPSPTDFWAEMPEPLERIVLRCLERDPQRRYATITELHDDLQQLRS